MLLFAAAFVDHLSASVRVRLVLGKLRKLGERTWLSVFIQNPDIGHSGFDPRQDLIEGFGGGVGTAPRILGLRFWRRPERALPDIS